jgi:hypothetical protein
VPEPNTELIVPVLINGAIFAAIAVIVPAFLLSRFTRDIIGRSVLVIFLFIAAGAYFGFATMGREVVDTQPIWTLIELAQVVVFGTMALLGLRGSPYWLAVGWALHPFWDFVVQYIGPGHPFTTWTYAIACQFRLASCHLYRYRLWTWTSRGSQTGASRRASLARVPLVAQVTASDFGSKLVILIQTRILVQRLGSSGIQL